MKRAGALFLLLLAAGCQEPVREVQTVEVKVPIVQRVMPPAELYADPPAMPSPHWITPLEAGASSCLSIEGEDRLRALILFYEEHRQALKAWAERAKTGP